MTLNWGQKTENGVHIYIAVSDKKRKYVIADINDDLTPKTCLLSAFVNDELISEMIMPNAVTAMQCAAFYEEGRIMEETKKRWY